MSFFARVYEIVEEIPYGKVATYQQVASLVSTPRAARAVGWALRALPHQTNVPWQRVVNSQGYLTIQNEHLTQDDQARLLEKEGIVVDKEADSFRVSLKDFLWSG